MMNRLKNWMAATKVEFTMEMNTQHVKAAEARSKGEELGYNLITGVYAPSYVAGYTAHATKEGAKKLGSKISQTKVAHGVKTIGYSAKEGATDGWNHYSNRFNDNMDAMMEIATKAFEKYEATIMSGGPIDETEFEA